MPGVACGVANGPSKLRHPLAALAAWYHREPVRLTAYDRQRLPRG